MTVVIFFRKTSRKGNPSKLSDEVKMFFDFFMAKKKKGKRKSRKPYGSENTDQSGEFHGNSEERQQELPTQTEAQVPCLLNLDSQGPTQQIPFGAGGMPHIVPFGDGTQQALVFLVNTPSVPSLEGQPGVNGLPMGNAVFVTQPITVNIPIFQPEAVDKDGAMQPLSGVIEKAMQLANVAEVSTQRPLTACPTMNPLLMGPSTNALSHISQNIVVGPSADSPSVENVVQSVTVQTTQIPQTVNRTSFPLETRQVNNVERQSAVPKVMYNRKGAKYREIPTQTGDKEGVVTLADSMAQQAAQTLQVVLPISRKEKDGKPMKKQGEFAGTSPSIVYLLKS